MGASRGDPHVTIAESGLLPAVCAFAPAQPAIAVILGMAVAIRLGDLRLDLRPQLILDDPRPLQLGPQVVEDVLNDLDLRFARSQIKPPRSLLVRRPFGLRLRAASGARDRVV